MNIGEDKLQMKTNIFWNFKGDLLGGITAGVIALPLAIALGVSSGLGATAGIYGAIIVGMLASIFGGTPTQVSGPTGPLTVVIASVLATHSNDKTLIFASILMAGLFQIILGLSRVGKLVNFIPYPVISGFMSGIGAIILLLQVNPFLGIEYTGSPVEGLIYALKNLNSTDIHTVIIGLITLAIVFLTPKKIAKLVPAPLIALILGTALTVMLGFNISVIGEIPRGFPSFVFPMIKFSDVKIIIPIALTIAVLGSIDSLLTSLVADSLTKTKHNSNRELIGQGIGNMVASLFGGVVSCGATMRTVVNIKSGGKTRLSGVIHSLFLIMIIVFFAPIASKIPLVVLAGILIKVGISIIDYKFLKLVKVAPRSDLLVMLLVFWITVFDDLMLAVGIGVVLSSILFAVNVARQTNVEVVGLSDKTDENYLDDDLANNTMIMHIDGTLFFGSASQIVSRIDDVLENRAVIIDCSKLKSMDISAVFAMEDLVLTLKSKKVRVVIIFNNREVAVSTLRLGLRKLISHNDIAFSTEEAISSIQKS